jgi:hypothetical protein
VDLSEALIWSLSGREERVQTRGETSACSEGFEQLTPVPGERMDLGIGLAIGESEAALADFSESAN